MTAVLLVAPTPVTAERAGPAIRYWELARVLSAVCPVTLLVPYAGHPTHPDFTVRTCTEDELDGLLATHDVVVVQGPALQQHPGLTRALRDGRHYVVADLYDPITLEQLAFDRGGAVGGWLNVEYTALLNEQMRLGDFFICASERQRDYWLGALASLGRVNPDTYDGGQLRELIDVVPFGLPAEPPQAGAAGLKGVLAGLGAEDRLIVWGGGLWVWLDPLTPIRAMAQVAERHPGARLVFFEADAYRTPAVEQARTLAAELGLLGRAVLFSDWLPADRWAACLLEADIGLSFHPDTVETRLAFRTRLLDYIWAGLPIATAAGDVLANQVAARGLGCVVSPGDVDGLAAALGDLLAEPEGRAARRTEFARLAAELCWERVAQPLVRYCQAPWHAGDIGQNEYRRAQAAGHDQLLAEAASARGQLARTERDMAALVVERDVAARRAAELEAQVAAFGARLEQSEQRFQAAMNGRVMRLLTGTQRALGSLRGRR